MVTKRRFPFIAHLRKRLGDIAPRLSAGYSLAEITLTMAIMGIMASVGAQLMVNYTRFNTMNSARAEIQREVRIAIDIMNRYLRQGRTSTVVVDQATGQPPYSRVSFTTIDGKTISYYQNGRELVQSVNTSSSVLSKNVRYLAFAYQDTTEDDLLSISIAMEKGTYESRTAVFKLSLEKVRIMN